MTDVVSGTREVGDRSCEAAYAKWFGPLYYSVDVGGAIHVIVLDSEETLGAGSEISAEQLAWLKGDLNKTFVGSETGAKKTKWVVVLVHRPLWRIQDGGNWARVHGMLVDFNRRPIVSVEGGAVSEGPRVAGVWAGNAREYCKEATRDGIRYTVVGATAARIEQDASVAVRHFTMLKLDDVGGGEGGVHPALVTLGGEGEAIIADDVVTEREREILDGIAGLPNEVMGVEGAVDFSRVSSADTRPAADASVKKEALTMVVGNPLDVALDVQIRLASAANLGTATARENANAFVENFDAPWEMDIPHQIRHLAPGVKERWPMGLTWGGKVGAASPAQVEFVVRWSDQRAGDRARARGGVEAARGGGAGSGGSGGFGES